MNPRLKLARNVCTKYSSYIQSRFRSSLPFNTIMMFVPQQEAWIVERMGKFNRILQPGLNFLLPIVESVRYVQSLKEIAIEIPQQGAITADNVGLTLDGVLYLKIFDPYKACYGVEDPEFAITQLAQTNMRSELGKISLDAVFKERESLNIMIVASINKASEAWGISCLRYEIRDVQLPPKVQEAMQMQVEAERKKRAHILESEGMRESAINIAEGEKRSRIMSSEAEKTEKINIANGEAEALIARAEARAKSLDFIAKALNSNDGKNSASFAIAEQYVNQFGNLAKQTNTLILPAQTGDISSMVSQALAIYKTVMTSNSGPNENQPGPFSPSHYTASLTKPDGKDTKSVLKPTDSYSPAPSHSKPAQQSEQSKQTLSLGEISHRKW